MDSDLKIWISDRLFEFIGYSNPVIVQYVFALAKQSSSPGDIAANLRECCSELSSRQILEFAQEIFLRVESRASQRLNPYRIEELEAERLERKQRGYKVFDDDDIECAPAVVDNRKTSGFSTGKKKQFRKRKRDDQEDDDREAIRADERQIRRSSSGIDADTDGSNSDEERIRDRRERDELDRKIRLHDTVAKRKLLGSKGVMRKSTKDGINKSDDLGQHENIEKLREFSRFEYLKKRETKKLEEFRDDSEHELNFYKGVKLGETENRHLKYKKEVYQLFERWSKDTCKDLGEYRIPEAYDNEGSVNQGRRFAAGLKGYEDAATGDKRTLFEEQESWEDSQSRKAKLMFGSRDTKRKSDDYQLVFDDHYFEKAEITNGDESDKKLLNRTFLKKMEFEKIQRDREALPVFQYREKLLQLVREHQILIVVGETGSGKTTQIPQYLHESGFTKRGIIGCTQPRRVAAMTVAARVAREMGVKLGREVGYSIRFEDCTSEKTVVKYLTDGMLLRELFGEPDLSSYSAVILDEAHERTIATDILFSLLKDVARLRPHFKLIISSATLDAEKFSKFFDGALIFHVPGRRYPVDIYHAKAPVPNYIDSAIFTALNIHVNEPVGDILIFFSGQEEIETAAEILKDKIRRLGKRVPEMIICPIYANLPSELQAKVFESTPEGARKVVLATNIAETSVTIDGVKYVIDTGFCKINSFSPRNGMESLLVSPISKASAKQRAGRSGRTGPGRCYRLYPKDNFDNLEEHVIPEMQRTNLGNIVLTLKTLGVDDLVHFDFMDPPPSEAILNALELLVALGALNDSGELTKLGRRMAEFPLDPKLSKMIVASEKYKCSVEILTIAAMLSTGSSIFYCPKEKKLQAENARMNFYADQVGDHVGMLNVYNAWKESNYSSHWCYENFVQVKTMKRARDIRDQLEGLLERVEVKLNSNLDDHEAIKKTVTSGFFLNAARIKNPHHYETIKNPQLVRLHPKSGLADIGSVPEFVIYNELFQTTTEYMREITEIKPEWLAEIAPHYFQMKNLKRLRRK